MVKIVLTKFGTMGARDIELVKNTLEECYLQLEPHEVAYVDLCLFESAAQMRAFFTREKLSLGIAGVFDDLFVAQHDAWRGTPRISICLDRLRALPNEAQVGNIRHEACHSILHGSIEYYMIPLSLISAFVDKREFSGESAASFVYLVSIAVKDFEVAKFLFERGRLKDQVAYATNILCTTEDERLAWRVSRGNRVAEILCIVSRFKEVCCAAPFLSGQRFGDELKDGIVENLSYLGSDIVEKLLWIAKHDLPKLGQDTMKNINVVSGLLLSTFLED